MFEDAGAVLKRPEAEALADRFAVGDKGDSSTPPSLPACLTADRASAMSPAETAQLLTLQ